MEVHLFDFSGELYGEILNVELIAYLRGEKTFENLEALKVQIAADCKEARRILSAVIPSPLEGRGPISGSGADAGPSGGAPRTQVRQWRAGPSPRRSGFGRAGG